MFLPEQIYSLTAKDAFAQLAPGAFRRRLVVNGAATLLSARPLQDLRQDQVLQLTHWCVRGVAGAGQNVLRIQLYLEDELLNTLYDLDDSLQAAANNVSVTGRSGTVLVMPKETIRCDVTFNAGAVANTLAVSVGGIIIPRASFQLS